MCYLSQIDKHHTTDTLAGKYGKEPIPITAAAHPN
jgi:hypothetical protein